ncbi:MAG: hypothetical protein C0183_17670 [Roseiflexus castenholzii]|uniref:DUF5990 family protein n=1 Tax=Roseiflexus castenholzii TaxID=120962 RepID=UPI000CBA29C8|nr:MAG: hypothetical protein C0183_17670 [Roseiflexus castenholzii]
MMKQVLHMRLICVNPPQDDHQLAEFGLQDRNGNLTPGVVLPDGALLFSFDVQADIRRDGSVNLSGRFVHGPPQGRFLYLGLRPPGGAWIRRIKVPLGSITADLVRNAGEGALAATVVGDRAATVHLQRPWHCDTQS